VVHGGKDEGQGVVITVTASSRFSSADSSRASSWGGESDAARVSHGGSVPLLRVKM